MGVGAAGEEEEDRRRRREDITLQSDESTLDPVWLLMRARRIRLLPKVLLKSLLERCAIAVPLVPGREDADGLWAARAMSPHAASAATGVSRKRARGARTGGWRRRT